MKYVRWLGAFGMAPSLHHALLWELTQKEREVAAEPLVGGKSGLRRPRVGLLLAARAVVRRFSGDVCSVLGDDGRLRPTRRPARTVWGEVFCRPIYRAIVVRRWAELSRQVRRTVLYFGRRFNLPVLEYPSWRRVDEGGGTMR